MRLTGPTRQSGKAGLRLRRSDRGHRAFIGGAFAALMALGGCGPGDFPNAEPAVEAPAVRPYCESNDCSGFPKGYHSVELNGEWVYVPAREFLRTTITDEVFTPLTRGTSGTIQDVLPRLAVESKTRYRYPADFERSLRELIERDGQTVPDATYIRIDLCCIGFGAFYDLPILREVSVGDIRISRSIEIVEPLSQGLNTFFSSEDAPEPWKGVALRFDLRLSDEQRDKPGATLVTALSKPPLIQGNRVLIKCGEEFCDVEWDSQKKSGFASGVIGGASLGLCPLLATDCYTHASINERFSRIEQFLADFDKMLERMKQHPEEAAQ